MGSQTRETRLLLVSLIAALCLIEYSSSNEDVSASAAHSAGQYQADQSMAANGKLKEHRSEEAEEDGNAEVIDFINVPGYGIVDDVNSTRSGNFSCYQRRYGYYADPARNCSMFHLCYPVQEPKSGALIYQRFAFYCSEDGIFDQYYMSCVDRPSAAIQCSTAPGYYEATNIHLMQVIHQSSPNFFAKNGEKGQVETVTAKAEPSKQQ